MGEAARDYGQFDPVEAGLEQDQSSSDLQAKVDRIRDLHRQRAKVVDLDQARAAKAGERNIEAESILDTVEEMVMMELRSRVYQERPVQEVIEGVIDSLIEANDIPKKMQKEYRAEIKLLIKDSGLQEKLDTEFRKANESRIGFCIRSYRQTDDTSPRNMAEVQAEVEAVRKLAKLNGISREFADQFLSNYEEQWERKLESPKTQWAILRKEMPPETVREFEPIREMLYTDFEGFLIAAKVLKEKIAKESIYAQEVWGNYVRSSLESRLFSMMNSGFTLEFERDRLRLEAEMLVERMEKLDSRDPERITLQARRAELSKRYYVFNKQHDDAGRFLKPSEQEIQKAKFVDAYNDYGEDGDQVWDETKKAVASRFMYSELNRRVKKLVSEEEAKGYKEELDELNQDSQKVLERSKLRSENYARLVFYPFVYANEQGKIHYLNKSSPDDISLKYLTGNEDPEEILLEKMLRRLYDKHHSALRNEYDRRYTRRFDSVRGLIKAEAEEVFRQACYEAVDIARQLKQEHRVVDKETVKNLCVIRSR